MDDESGDDDKDELTSEWGGEKVCLQRLSEGCCTDCRIS